MRMPISRYRIGGDPCESNGSQSQPEYAKASIKGGAELDHRIHPANLFVHRPRIEHGEIRVDGGQLRPHGTQGIP